MEETDSDDELRFTTKKIQVRESLIRKKYDEERDKERRAEAKFCIDVGTQTHGWHLNPSNNNSSSNSPQGRVIR